ncbi:MAG: methyltransferase, partial [Chloroflexi bacterium]|nr:methyltransferase [Chloroflexota bacterium]
MYNSATETLEQLNIGQLQFIQPQQGYRFSIDAVLLADFLSVKPDERLIDLGSGTGIIPLLSAVLTPAREIIALELQDRLAELAKRNIA